MTEAGSEIAGYRIESVIGRGGMGTARRRHAGPEEVPLKLNAPKTRLGWSRTSKPFGGQSKP
jgi:hypothetical protein